MNRKISFLFIILTQIVVCQDIKKLSEFNKLKVFDGIQVKLIQSNENTITIPSNFEDKIEIVTINDELKIRMKIENFLKGKEVSIDLTFKNLDFIDASEGSYVYNEETIKQRHLNLNSKEGAKINLTLDIEYLTSRAVSGSVLELSGNSKINTCSLGTGANFEGKDLKTTETIISINTGAEATIFSTEFVDSNIKTGGNLYIYGNPKHVNRKNFLGGVFKLIKE